MAIFSGAYQHIIDGVSMTLNRLAQRLESQGHRVLVFCPTTPTSPLSAEALAAAEIESVPSVQAPFRPEYRMALGLGANGYKRLADFAPTIVHVATPDLLGSEAQAWAHEHHVPVVCSYHTHFATYVKYYNLGIFEGPLWAYMSTFYNGCLQVYVPAPEVGADLEEHGLHPGKSLPWRRGVNAEQFTPALRDAPRWRREVLAPAAAASRAMAGFQALGSAGGVGPGGNALLVQRPMSVPGVTAGAAALAVAGMDAGSRSGGGVGSGGVDLAAGASVDDTGAATQAATAATADAIADTPVLLVACRMVWEKGLDDVAEVDAILRAEGVRFTMVVVGDGPARAGLAKKMPEAIFMGTMTGASLWATYANADAYLMPSRTETFGATVLEALASGVPSIVAANASGTSRLVTEGAGFQAKDAAAMAEAAKMLLTDPELRTRMSVKAHASALTYEWGNVFAELEGHYARALRAWSRATSSAGRRRAMLQLKELAARTADDAPGW